MAGVKGDIGIRLNLVQTGTAGLGTPKLPVAIESTLSLTPGTDATNKADILWQSSGRFLAASASEDLDLAGVLTDAFGSVVTAGEIIAIYVHARAANTNSIVIGGASQPFAGPLGAAGTYTVKPGEYYLAVSQSGWAVGAGATDDLKIANGSSGSGVLYDIVIVGRTAAA